MAIGTFKYFVLYLIYTASLAIVGILVIAYNKIYNEQEKQLEHLDLNIFKTALQYSTIPMRETVVYVFGIKRETVWLPDDYSFI